MPVYRYRCGINMQDGNPDLLATCTFKAKDDDTARERAVK
jgi:hypothetical protein